MTTYKHPLNDRVIVRKKVYLVKESLHPYSCYDCAFWSPSRGQLCGKAQNDIRSQVTGVVGDKYDTNNSYCGLDEHILVEDTPESILHYLDHKLNGVDEEEDDE
jgi:hypothetical protein